MKAIVRLCGCALHSHRFAAQIGIARFQQNQEGHFDVNARNVCHQAKSMSQPNSALGRYLSPKPGN